MNAEMLQEATRAALERHTAACVAWYIACPTERVLLWADGSFPLGRYFKGEWAVEEYDQVVADLYELAQMEGCGCRQPAPRTGQAVLMEWAGAIQLTGGE